MKSSQYNKGLETLNSVGYGKNHGNGGVWGRISILLEYKVPGGELKNKDRKVGRDEVMLDL